MVVPLSMEFHSPTNGRLPVLGELPAHRGHASQDSDYPDSNASVAAAMTSMQTSASKAVASMAMW